MQVSETPPADWDARVVSPFLSGGFALASGQQTLYVDGGAAMALVLFSVSRSWIVRSPTRATMYVSGGTAPFVRGVLRELAENGIDEVCVGDANLGLPRLTLEQAGITPLTSQRLTLTTAGNDGEFLARMSFRRRTALQRAEAEGVVVSEIRTQAELAQYCALPESPGTVGGLPSMALYAILRAMVPKGQAVFLLARHDERPIAGALYFVSRHRMSCFHEVSTRAPQLTYLQGPTAVIWHAMRAARARTVPRLDLGAVTPTMSAGAPETYPFKREFGGVVEPVHHGEGPAGAALPAAGLEAYRRARDSSGTAGRRRVAPVQASSVTGRP
jgi:Acetyltransferase (GNAT) domain